MQVLNIVRLVINNGWTLIGGILMHVAMVFSRRVRGGEGVMEHNHLVIRERERRGGGRVIQPNYPVIYYYRNLHDALDHCVAHHN